MKEAIERLKAAIANAERVYRDNKASGAPAVSLAHDEGRHAGLREALDLLLEADHGNQS